MELIKKSLDNIIKSNSSGNKTTIFAVKGIPYELINKIECNKPECLKNPHSLDDLYYERENILKSLITSFLKPDKKNIYILTYEELVSLNIQALLSFCEIVIINNNLYNKKYLLQYKIDNIDDIVKYFENEEFGDEIVEKNKVFFEYYGEVIKLEDEYYISYREPEGIKEIDLFENISDEIKTADISIYDDSIIEISENEEDFLLFTKQILNNRIKSKEIKISTYSGIDQFLEMYKKRLLILQEIFRDKYIIEIDFKQSKKKEVDEKPYLEVLKKYWGYNSFKNIKNYKAINYDISKDTVDISQAQIIDDIVSQVENCVNEREFKDVFVTAPTGAGKSVMFQIPAIYLAERYNLLTIVVSPLIGLMFDQVKGLEKRAVNISATINSNITPVQKSVILDKIKANEVSILYVSPETLLSRSDINMLIGERRLGLVIIDEAHIVTTWGKAFRSDYWYLGTYLNRLRKERNFPIATFTATAIYAGIEDMYKETKESLYMKNPISHFGYIKRENINMKIKKIPTESSFKEYRNMKFKILALRLEYFFQNNQKTLVYFPTISLIDDFYIYAKNNCKEEIVNCIAKYYGPLDKLEKEESYNKFLSGDKIFMLATKAFGMGIDISDIHNIYHFAPTGNVCDFVQEVGRVARGLPEGKAYFDYLPQDFVHVRRLHGLSTIKKYQIVQVTKKILEIMDMKKEKQRHFTIDPASFAYIFKNKSSTEIDMDEVSNKLKISLLLLEKDLSQKLGYPPIIARPQNIFIYEFFKFNNDDEDKIKKTFEKYFKVVDNYENDFIYSFNLKELWEDRYLKYTFPMFKFMLHSRSDELNLEYIDSFNAMLRVDVKIKDTMGGVKRKFDTLIDEISNVLNDLYIKQTYFNHETISQSLGKKHFKSEFVKNGFCEVLLMTAGSFDRVEREKSNFYQSFLKWDENKEKFQIKNNNYTGFIKWCSKEYNYLFNKVVIEEQSFFKYYPKYCKDKLKMIFLFMGLLESADFITYIITGGDAPQVFIRVNSRFQLDKINSNPDAYYNQILSNVHLRHKLSVEMLTYLFKNEVNTVDFWDNIEDYFFGKIPDEVEKELRIGN